MENACLKRELLAIKQKNDEVEATKKSVLEKELAELNSGQKSLDPSELRALEKQLGDMKKSSEAKSHEHKGVVRYLEGQIDQLKEDKQDLLNECDEWREKVRTLEEKLRTGNSKKRPFPENDEDELEKKKPTLNE